MRHHRTRHHRLLLVGIVVAIIGVGVGGNPNHQHQPQLLRQLPALQPAPAAANQSVLPASNLLRKSLPSAAASNSACKRICSKSAKTAPSV